MAYLHNKRHNSKLAILMCQGNNTFTADYFKKKKGRKKNKGLFLFYNYVYWCFLTVCIMKITF